MDKIKMWSSEMKKEYGRYVPVLIILFAFSIIIYSQLWSNQLVNDFDGLWNGDYHKSGRWELSNGRWFWLYIDRLRLGLSSDPIMTMSTLLFFSLGVVLLLNLLEMGNSWRSYLAGMLFMGNTAVCVSLSYRFMSPTFGLAFLLSIMSACAMIKIGNSLLSIVMSAAFIALSMGLYQAYLGCTCLALIAYFLCELFRKDIQTKQIIKKMAHCAISVVCGGVFYIVALKLHLWVFHVEMADYRGGSTYSVSNSIIHFPASFLNTYKEFFRYFLKGGHTFQCLPRKEDLCRVFCIDRCLACEWDNSGLEKR